jgi:hypothetical protein
MSLTIKDIEVAKELSREERAAVYGGSILQVGSLQAVAANNGGFNLGSPVTTTQVNPQTANETNVVLASVVNSAGVLIPTFIA